MIAWRTRNIQRNTKQTMKRKEKKRRYNGRPGTPGSICFFDRAEGIIIIEIQCGKCLLLPATATPLFAIFRTTLLKVKKKALDRPISASCSIETIVYEYKIFFRLAHSFIWITSIFEMMAISQMTVCRVNTYYWTCSVYCSSTFASRRSIPYTLSISFE